MFEVAKDGKFTINIGKFQLTDYLEEDFLEIIEDFTSAILQDLPPHIWLQTDDKEYHIICNINECYILEPNNTKIRTEKISLLEFGNNLHQDLMKNKRNIIQLSKEFMEDVADVEEIIDINLETILVCKNALKENFEFVKGNLIHNTLEALNYALYLHASGMVYDKMENTEFFRLFDYDKTYVIEVTKQKNKNRKVELTIVDMQLSDVAIKAYNDLKDKRKLKRTKELLDRLKDNLLEYGIRLDKN